MVDMEHLRRWLGRTEETVDVASSWTQTRLAALLDHRYPPWPPDQLAPLCHWLHFAPATLQSQLGEDGHTQRGDFLPPVELPRRMYAGGRLHFVRPIRLGDSMRRRSTVKAIEAKTGSSGAMVFVTVRHEISTGERIAIEEEQDIVYRSSPAQGAARSSTEPPGEEPVPDATRLITVDPTLLFRYSALAFVAHRIHYDYPYAHQVEGYPGLLVHGPLIATLLLDHFLRRHPAARVGRFEFRSKRPLFAGSNVEACLRGNAREAELWARTPTGEAAMLARVEAQ